MNVSVPNAPDDTDFLHEAAHIVSVDLCPVANRIFSGVSWFTFIAGGSPVGFLPIAKNYAGTDRE